MESLKEMKDKHHTNINAMDKYLQQGDSFSS